MTKNKKNPTRATMEIYEEARKMSCELLNELKEILTNQNFKIEIKSLFPDIGFLYAKKKLNLFNNHIYFLDF